MPIPSKVHFIWLGSNIPRDYAENILNWSMQNPTYEIHVWVQQQMIDTNVEIFIEEFRQINTASPIIHEDVVEEFTGKLINIYRAADAPVQIFVDIIGLVPPLSDPGTLFQEIATYKNYGAASDILRIWILHFQGGIYVDCDISPPFSPLNVEIQAPKGILFAITYGIDGELGPYNAVVAANAQQPALQELALFLQAGYGETEKIIQRGEPYPSERQQYMKNIDDRRAVFRAAKEKLVQLEGVSELEEKHAAFDPVPKGAYRPLPEPEQIKEDYHKAFVELYNAMAIDTVMTTGPARIRAWVEQREGGTLDNATISLYNFQEQSKCFLELDSHMSWIK